MAYQPSLEQQCENEATLPHQVIGLFVARTQDWHEAEMTKRKKAVRHMSLDLLGEMRGALCRDPGADDAEDRKNYCEEKVRRRIPTDSLLCKMRCEEVEKMVREDLLKLTQSETGKDGRVKLYIDSIGDWTKEGNYMGMCGRPGLMLTLNRKL